ncbi:sugar phosphate isomerase/epimerase family protein [Paenibacillus roseipurpureus]|uniref:Sugar phosphate isomerase/epimerase family protein n=1 Tax=Paenibacillus roseopurpureus TaxID=2918901 RepID=A0AA96LKC3_9BACL|nr:sugar phosphate isomerase/epimerase family protein [Paenibacillus sp. MBLB1832]WNR42646.1 sugar phosphate isomerase/epimerase family protein [Paenibacillus sp. MBLB1832]
MLINPIGIMVDSLRLGLHEGLKKSKELGADGVQIYAVSGEMDPANLSPQARKDLKNYIASLDLQISALCGDLGGHGFQDASVNPVKIEKSKRILDLAVELGTTVVTTHIGVVPADRNDPIYETMLEACEELGVYANSLGAYFAVETGPETSAHLKSFLDNLSTKGVSVNFDPANMVMVTGDDPVQGVYTLKDYIVHTHVKDGIRLRQVDPRQVYGSLGYKPMTHEGIAAEATSGDTYRELALGEGHVDFGRYFAALQDIGYKGYLTIEREVGEQPEKDIASAIAFIKKFK